MLLHHFLRGIFLHTVCEAKVKHFLYRRVTALEGSRRLRLPDFEIFILISSSIPTRPTVNCKIQHAPVVYIQYLLMMGYKYARNM
jgi:hypothetical protein